MAAMLYLVLYNQYSIDKVDTQSFSFLRKEFIHFVYKTPSSEKKKD